MTSVVAVTGREVIDIFTSEVVFCVSATVPGGISTIASSSAVSSGMGTVLEVVI